MHPNCPFYFYISRINNRLVIKKKTQCKLELQMPETMKLLGSAKNGENKIADKIVKPRSVPEGNSTEIEEIIIPQEKREKIGIIG